MPDGTEICLCIGIETKIAYLVPGSRHKKEWRSRKKRDHSALFLSHILMSTTMYCMTSREGLVLLYFVHVHDVANRHSVSKTVYKMIIILLLSQSWRGALWTTCTFSRCMHKAKDHQRVSHFLEIKRGHVSRIAHPCASFWFSVP